MKLKTVKKFRLSNEGLKREKLVRKLNLKKIHF